MKKIAITGHTSGIGRGLTQALSAKGHSVIGLSRTNGGDIRHIDKILPLILDCDIFINNAQQDFNQTDLLYEVWDHWRTLPNKHIWCISSMMTLYSTQNNRDDASSVQASRYRNQKISLEDACFELQAKSAWPDIVVMRPGPVDTPGCTNPQTTCAHVDTWCETMLDIIRLTESRNLRIREVSLKGISQGITI